MSDRHPRVELLFVEAVLEPPGPYRSGVDPANRGMTLDRIGICRHPLLQATKVGLEPTDYRRWQRIACESLPRVVNRLD
jgi:hypothetical protein